MVSHSETRGLGRRFGLRAWLEDIQGMEHVETVKGAHWDLEIGVLTELISERHEEPPAIIFDDVVGYESGFRVLANLIDTPARLAHTLGLDPSMSALEFVDLWRRRQQDAGVIPPHEVPVDDHFDHIDEGSDADLFKFPVPRWHELDGGRYIGTADLVVIGGPEKADWLDVNLGTYRVMGHDSRTMASYISPGKHGRVLRDRHFELEQNCPVVVVAGQDPLLFVAASSDVPDDRTELEYVGGIIGEPVPVVRGPATGLPIPADAEIAIEGEISFEHRMQEGPFGEWTGYYASGVREEPVINVKSILYKNNPIICGAPPMPPSSGKGNFRSSVVRSAHIWNALEAAGVPGVTGVWMPVPAGRFMTVVAIDQQYEGHAKQAAAVASQCRQGAYLGRYVVVVDSDIDVTNFDDVLWAICTRSDPQESIEILRHTWSGPLDPRIPPGSPNRNSRALIDATRPYSWRADFPAVCGASAEYRDELRRKWSGQIDL